MPTAFETGSRKLTLSTEAGLPALWKTIGSKNTDELTDDPCQLIGPQHEQLSITQQCNLLSVARSSYYYQLVGESAENLASWSLLINPLLSDLKWALGGYIRRLLQWMVHRAGAINIKRVHRLMQLVGMEAIY